MPDIKDVLGIQGVSNAIEKSAEGVGTFLARICNPAAEEFGLLLRDQVQSWRTGNLIKMARKAEHLLNEKGGVDGKYSHPRIAMKILEEASWTDDDLLQDMWAGLLATSCTPEGKDDSNLIFINLLSQLTGVGAAMLNHACEISRKVLTPEGWLDPELLLLNLAALQTVCKIDDLFRIDRELDHLSSIGLLELGSGFRPYTNVIAAQIRVTGLALQLYARCHGHDGDPAQYFEVVGRST